MASCPKMQTLMALAVELSHKLERRPKEIYARGVPGVHVDVFSSGAAVEALQTCAGLAKETREEARRVWEQLVAASFVKHVSSSRRKRNSLDQGMGRERKDKVGAHTLYRFDDRAFAPYTLHVAVLAVRGLPPGHTASSMVAVGGQNSDFTALHDDARRGAARESDMPNFKGSDLGHAHRGSAAIHATDWYQSVNTEFEAYGYDPEWPDAPTAARVGFEWSLVGGRLCGRAGANRATAAVDLRLPSTMHLQSKAAADQPTKTPHAHDADGNLICDLLSDKAAYRFEHDSCEHRAEHALGQGDGRRRLRGGVVLEFGSKIAGTERLTVARQKKDFSSDGCDFGGQRLRNVGLVARRNAQVKFTLYERLKTDLTKTRTLGNVSVPLSDVPVLEPHKGRGVLAKHRKPSPQRYDLTYRRIIDGSEIKNGTALRWGFWAAFVGLTAGLAYAFRGGLFEACLFVSPLPILLLLMEAPQFLTWVLGLAVPGLNLGFGALRLTCWFSDTKPSAASSPQDAAALAAGASRRLCLRVEVDDFSIGNPGRPGTHAHEHFVFAAKVVLAISLDARLFHGAVDLAKNALQSAWDYKRDLAEAKRKKTAPLPKPPRVVMWSPFPAVHAEQRNDEDFEPTRIGSLRFDEIRVDDVNVAFNQSTANEFNINHFVRGLAAGKVGQALPPGAKAPNALTVTVVGARGVHEKIAPQIEVHCRDFRWEASARPRRVRRARLPLLFDVRSFEVTRINFYLKDLFSSVGRAAASTSMIEKAKMERSSSGQIKNHVWTFVFCAVRPELREVNVGAALGHIASGFFAGSNPAGAGASAAAAAPGLVGAARGAGGTMVHTSTLAKDAVLRAVHRNADKYVDERDNALMLETALAEGYLDKAVERLSGCRLGRRPWVLEWCVLKRHDGHLTLFYTKKDDSGFRGATKKARLSEVRYDAAEGQFCVLVTKLGKRKKILHFRASKFRGAATDKVLAVGEWWKRLNPEGGLGDGDWVAIDPAAKRFSTGPVVNSADPVA
ncbi:hypothetical protein JL722_2986 [Aureococcus anophagefferens]|nr:hypothetical protein JL722_2986 [Aureococcus anophagefferens]